MQDLTIEHILKTIRIFTRWKCVKDAEILSFFSPSDSQIEGLFLKEHNFCLKMSNMIKFFGVRRRLSSLIRNVGCESNEFREEVASIVREHLTGHWKAASSSNLLMQEVRGGMNNWLFQITLPTANNKILHKEPQTVLLRLHQPLHPDSVFEYISESAVFIYLSERNLGPKLFGIFQGGRIEEYIHARPLKTDELKDLKFSLIIAEKMAQIHFMNFPFSKKKDTLFDLMFRWLNIVNDFLKSQDLNNLEIKKHIDKFKKFDLISEIFWLRNFLGIINSPILFCHNDIQEGNILVTFNSLDKPTPDILIIDYEYSFYNYQGFELANHFLEYTFNYESKDYPYFTINEDDYPSVDHQLKFIRHYFNTIKQCKENLSKNKIANIHRNSFTDFSHIEKVNSDAEIRLLTEISHFRLASHLFWGIWAALRSRSDIKFGYWEYCFARLEAYFRTKEEIKLFKSLH